MSSPGSVPTSFLCDMPKVSFKPVLPPWPPKLCRESAVPSVTQTRQQIMFPLSIFPSNTSLKGMFHCHVELPGALKHLIRLHRAESPKTMAQDRLHMKGLMPMASIFLHVCVYIYNSKHIYIYRERETYFNMRLFK